MNKVVNIKKRRRNRIAQLRRQKQRRRNILRIFIHALGWIGAAVVYYVVVSLFFDTPFESSLRNSSKRLYVEYELLKSRYDSLNMVMENIEERDLNIFGIMFESAPYDFASENDERLLELSEMILRKQDDELQMELTTRADALAKKVAALKHSTMEMVEKVETTKLKSGNIPSIQPIANNQLTLLTASFGQRIHPFYKTIQQHNGVDYTIPEGTRIFATADGVIKSYEVNSSATGKNVVINHGNGYETIYNHLSRVDIPRSRRVKRGEIIGMSGNTGLSLTPHLHYEVRYNGESVDPIHYFFRELTPSDYKRIQKIAQSGMQSFD